MQSGIAVSPELRNAFNAFTSDPSLFCLPVTITSENLTPLPPIPFSSPTDFYGSIPRLSSVLTPRTPIYLILRKDGSLIALTYIPSDAPVRSKTLFASTRTSLARELGSEKFTTPIFATEEEEVISEEAWRERDAETNSVDTRPEDVVDERERERSRTAGEDVEVGGALGRISGGTSRSMSFPLAVHEAAKQALRDLQKGGMVQLAIDISTETIILANSQQNVFANSVASAISDSSPRYTFYHYPSSDSVVFIYTCPSGSTIKERMLYASSRKAAVTLGQLEGLKVSKRIEESSPDEITAARLHEEMHPLQHEGPKKGFARPKRPGK